VTMIVSPCAIQSRRVFVSFLSCRIVAVFICGHYVIHKKRRQHERNIYEYAPSFFVIFRVFHGSISYRSLFPDRGSNGI
jgi:hypothetical protein